MKYLHAICSLLNIQTSFINDRKKLVHTPTPVLHHLIHLLSGHKTSSYRGESKLEATYNLLKQEKLERWLPQSLVAWDGILPTLKVNIPTTRAQQTFTVLIKNRNSEVNSAVSYSWSLSEFKPHRYHRVQLQGQEIIYLCFQLPWPADKYPENPPHWEPGYFELQAHLGSERQNSLLIVAPKKLPLPYPSRDWGLFSPLYALRSQHDEGMGSLKELEQVQDFLKQQGGHFVGTLPLLAPVSHIKPFDPSPYSPSSRLFANEIYLDISKIVHQMNCIDYFKNLPSMDGTADLEKLRTSEYVDYEAIYHYKKKLLLPLADYFFSHHLPTDPDFAVYLKQYPEVKDYGRFRGDEKFHTFVQYQFHQQLLQNRQRADQDETAHLYLDFPVGVNPQGFDVQHFPEVFLNQATMGAPPDSFFSEGQNWGTTALHPKNLQKNDCQYLIRSLRHHMQYASLLRLDHVMSLHRLYLIPQGASAKDGAYVRYPTEILYGLLCLEASQYRSQIIGEDLGTVPPLVREKMQEHACQRMWVFELESAAGPDVAIEGIPKDSLVSLNTHDMLPLARFWQQQRTELLPWLKLLTLRGCDKGKEASFEDILQSLVEFLASSKARHFLMNLEDLWAETEPQNTPGLVSEKIWRKKNRFFIEDWSQQKSLLRLFEKIKQGRSA